MTNQSRATDLIRLLGEPVRVVEKIKASKKKRVEAIKFLTKHIFPQWHHDYIFKQQIQVTKSVQFLNIDFATIVSGLKRCDQYEELAVKQIVLSYQPFISRGMSGQLTVLFCDFRSTLIDNIVKVGFTFPVAEDVDALSISPGYVVSLKDPNLHKIFRFFLITSGLDLAKESIYGKVSIIIHYSLGGTKNVQLNNFDSLTLVSSKKAVSLFSDQHGPALVEESDVDDIAKAFEDLETENQAYHNPNVQRFDRMSQGLQGLKRSFSVNSAQSNSSCEVPRPSDAAENSLLQKLKSKAFIDFNNLNGAGTSGVRIADDKPTEDQTSGLKSNDKAESSDRQELDEKELDDPKSAYYPAPRKAKCCSYVHYMEPEVIELLARKE